MVTTTTPPSISIVTSVVTTTVSPAPSPPPPPRPELLQGDWKYAGCYKDDASRALKGPNNLGQSSSASMSNAICIDFCEGQGYTISGTEFGGECYCGNELVDSWLLGDESCNMTCSGDVSDICGGPFALAIYNPNGQAPISQGPELRFTLTEPPPGVSEVTVHVGGLRQTVLPVTTPVFAYPPPPPPSPASSSTSSSCTTTTTISGENPFTIPGGDGGPGPVIPSGATNLTPAAPGPSNTASAKPLQVSPGTSTAGSASPTRATPAGSPPAGAPPAASSSPNGNSGQGSPTPAIPGPSGPPETSNGGTTPGTTPGPSGSNPSGPASSSPPPATSPISGNNSPAGTFPGSPAPGATGPTSPGAPAGSQPAPSAAQPSQAPSSSGNPPAPASPSPPYGAPRPLPRELHSL